MEMPLSHEDQEKVHQYWRNEDHSAQQSAAMSKESFIRWLQQKVLPIVIDKVINLAWSQIKAWLGLPDYSAGNGVWS